MVMLTCLKWYYKSVIPYAIKAARHSRLATISTKIIYVDYKLIGIHEECKPGWAEEIAASILKHGYRGPAISVFQVGSDELYESAGEGEKVALSYGDLGVADGHHRLAAIINLGIRGLLKDSAIPVQVIPAHDQCKIRTVSFMAGAVPTPITAIEAYLRNSTQAFPYGSTHFQTVLTTGEWVPISESQPDMNIQASQLFQAAVQPA